MPLHSAAQGIELHESKRQKEPVRAASIANVNVAVPGATLDGVTLSTSDRVLLKNQTTASANGIYVWSGAATPLVRAADADQASDFTSMHIVGVREGTANAGSYWVYRNTTALNLDTDNITFAALQSSSFSGEAVAADVSVTGLTGVVNASRYVGAVNGAAPTSGTFSVGDFVVDRTYGGFWVCVTSGSPGIWRQVGGPLPNAGSKLFLASNCI